MSEHVIQMHSVTFNTMCQAVNAESSAIKQKTNYWYKQLNALKLDALSDIQANCI